MAQAENRFRLSPKRTSPFNSAGASVQSTAGSRGVRVSGSNAGNIVFRGSVRVLDTHSIHQFPLHFPSRASPCAIRFQLDSTAVAAQHHPGVHPLFAQTGICDAIVTCFSIVRIIIYIYVYIYIYIYIYIEYLESKAKYIRTVDQLSTGQI